MLNLHIFGLEFLRGVVIFEIGSASFVYLQNFMKKQIFLNLGPKMPDFGLLGQEF